MVHFVFCYECEEILDFVKEEVLNYFRQREIAIAARCCHNAPELEQCIARSCPDILFYDMDREDGLLRRTVMKAKRENHKLISVITRAQDCIAPAEDVLLEPLYVMPGKSRKHLQTYAALAYEAVLDDPDSFSYYVRPEYIQVPVKEIRYFASEGRRTHIVSSDRRDSFYQKLDVVEALLCQKNCRFMRIHKSYLVNASCIAGYSRDYVLLTTGEQLRISRYEYYKSLSDQLQSLKSTRQGRRMQCIEW